MVRWRQRIKALLEATESRQMAMALEAFKIIPGKLGGLGTGVTTIEIIWCDYRPELGRRTTNGRRSMQRLKKLADFMPVRLQT